MPNAQVFKVHRLKNGLTLLGEEMESVSSAAFAILVPVGAATDPSAQEGAANLMSEMFNKGAGPWNSQQLSEEFENIGVSRSHAAGIEVSIFSGAMLGENLPRALEIYSTVMLEPHFPEDALDSVKQLALQDLAALEDEPASKVMSELARVFYPEPFGRSQLGTDSGIKTVTIDSLRQYYIQRFLPGHSLIAVAGKFDWDAVKHVVETRFGEWSGEQPLLEVGAFPQENKTHHLQRETSQVQIALAYPSVSFDHHDYYKAKVAVSLLSGGMAGRLFIEVREKRGLVYRISASHSSARKRAAIFVSAGTTPQHAEETLKVALAELQRVGEGITAEELARAKADLKSRLIMQSELSSVRASALVNDWWNLNRVRTIEEIKQGIDAVSAEDIAGYSGDWPASPVVLATLGPQKLELGQ